MSSGPVPVRLQPDNFTPPARTPWGGRNIVRRYKPGLAAVADTQHLSDVVVGESWEVSVEPSFPSRVVGSSSDLATHIAADPRAWLGAADSVTYGQLQLLVKLLDAAAPLSVQVHPADGDPALAADEAGKPEAWIVLDADAGAGLYLGFADGVARSDVRACLETGGELNRLMNFVPCAPGDAFVIEAGTAHAIGPGLTLLEPQHVAPGRRGLTYRFWDWNRRYDAAGNPDPAGQPRELHVARSLAVTNWQSPGGDTFVAGCRATPQTLASDDVNPSSGAVEVVRVINWRWFQVDRLTGTGATTLQTGDRLLALTCVGGEIEIDHDGGVLRLACGDSAVVPAAAAAVHTRLVQGTLYVTHSATDHFRN